MTIYAWESFYRATIRQSIAINTLPPFTLKVSKVPTLTTWLLTISPNTSNEEIFEYNAIDAVALTITISKRWVNKSSQVLTTNWIWGAIWDYNNSLYMTAHSQNDSIRWDLNHLHIIQDYGTLNATKLNKSWGLRDTMLANQNINATNLSTAITVADTTGWSNWATITWTWIPVSTTIVSFVPNTSAVLSNAFTWTTWVVSVTVWIRYNLEIDVSWNEIKKSIINGTLISQSETIRKRKAWWEYEEIPFSIIQSALSPTFLSTNINLIAWENITMNDSVVERVLNGWIATYVNIGDVAGNTIVTIWKRFSSWVTGNSITIPTNKITPTANFNVRIVTTDGAGNPTTTLVDTNSSVSIIAWSVSTGWANTTITFPWSFSCGTRWALVAIQVCQWASFASTTVNASQYYAVWLMDGFNTLFTNLSTAWTSTNSTSSPWTYGYVYFTVTPIRRIKIIQITASYNFPSGMPVKLSVAWKADYIFTTSSASSTITLPIPYITSSLVTISLGTQYTQSWNPYWVGANTFTPGTSADCTVALVLNTDSNSNWILNLWVVTTSMTDCISPWTIFESSEILKTDTKDSILGWFTGIAPVTSLKWVIIPSVINAGNYTLSWLSSWSAYYLSDTPWIISVAPGRITKQIGIATTQLNLFIKSPI